LLPFRKGKALHRYTLANTFQGEVPEKPVVH
jgi:hypothetical protein